MMKPDGHGRVQKTYDNEEWVMKAMEAMEAQGFGCLFGFSKKTRRSSCAVPGIRRGSEYACYCEVSVLADDYGE